MTQVVKPYKVTNNESTTLASYSATIPNDDGYVYVSHTAEAGTYDPATKVWTITNFPSGTTYTLNITWEVQVNETCTGNCLDEAVATPININHGNTLTISGKIPCSALCDNGTTVLSLVDFSDNVEVDLDVSSGDYLVTLLDPTYDWYFEYTIECIYCNQKTGPFGPARIEGKAPDQVYLSEYPETNASKAGQRFWYQGFEWHYMTQEDIDSIGWAGLVEVGFPVYIDKGYNLIKLFPGMPLVYNQEASTVVNLGAGTQSNEIDFLGLGNPTLFKLLTLGSGYNPTTITKFRNASLLTSLEDIGTSVAMNLVSRNLTDTVIDDLFEQLPNTNLTVTIDVRFNAGAATCNPIIATTKGYTVVTT